jgi:hypothetical protein
VALPDVVLDARLVGGAVLKVDGAAHRPHAAGLALDPDDHALQLSRVVPTGHRALREAPASRKGLHALDYTIATL